MIVDKKTNERPIWSPADLNDVSAEIVANFFEPKSPYLTLAPELTIPAELTSGTTDATKLNPAKYALPSEEEIGSIFTSSHDRSTIRFEELWNKVTERRPGKLGLQEKVLDVVQRRCEVTENAEGAVWLKWKSLSNDDYWFRQV